MAALEQFHVLSGRTKDIFVRGHLIQWYGPRLCHSVANELRVI